MPAMPSPLNGRDLSVRSRSLLALVATTLAVAPAAQAQRAGSGGGGTTADLAAPAPLATIRLYSENFRNVQLRARMTGDDGRCWTAEGDPACGPATAVEVRYRTTGPDGGPGGECTYDAVSGAATESATGASCFRDGNWAGLSGRTFSGVPNPGEGVVLWASNAPTTYLTPGTTYVISARVVDDAGNRSALSPLVLARAQAAGDYPAWGASTVAAAVPDNSVQASLAFDGSGVPAVAYTPTSGEVRLARRAGDVWSSERIDAARTLGRGVQLVYDAEAGRFGLAYGGSEAVKYAERGATASAGAAWSTQTVAAASRASFSVGPLSLVRHGPGGPAAGRYPVLAYGSPTGNKLAHRPGTAWALAGWPAGTAPPGSDYAVVANPADPAGRALGMAYIAQEPGSTYVVYYAESADGGASWTGRVELDRAVATPFSSAQAYGTWGGLISGVVLAFDPVTGAPYVAYKRGYAHSGEVALMHRANGAAVWARELPLDGDPRTRGSYLGQRGFAFDGDRQYLAWYKPNGGELASHRDRDAVTGAWGPWRHEFVGMTEGATRALAVGAGGPALLTLLAKPSGGYELRYAARAAGSARAAVTPPAAGGTPARVASAALLAPAPNPAVSRVALRFSLAAPGRARLAVYDLLGREVARLVDSELAAGWHEATLDAPALAPGTYVARLTVDGAAVVRRITVTR